MDLILCFCIKIYFFFFSLGDPRSNSRGRKQRKPEEHFNSFGNILVLQYSEAVLLIALTLHFFWKNLVIAAGESELSGLFES